MPFFMVRGEGDPNTAPAYAAAVQALYTLSYGVKMSKKGEPPENYFDFVVPPLEGLWWFGPADLPVETFDKTKLRWTAMIRQPEFVTPAYFARLQKELAKKKKEVDLSAVTLENYDEGLCVQAMHHGPYAEEPATIATMERFAKEKGYRFDLAGGRFHHEIYLSDPSKTPPDKLRTILRYPVAKI